MYKNTLYYKYSILINSQQVIKVCKKDNQPGHKTGHQGIKSILKIKSDF